MKKLFTLLCLCTLFFFANAQCPLTNDGFENGLSGWNLSGDVEITNDANSGSSAVRICGVGSSINQIFPTQPGKQYSVGLSIKGEPGHKFSLFKFRTLDANWQPLENGLNYSSRFYTGSGSFIFSDGSPSTFTTPPNAAWFQVVVWNQDGGGCVIIDDVKACETGTPPPPPNPCDNDTQPPVFTRCPSDQIATTTGTTAFVNWGGAAASDNCGPPTFSGNNDQGIGNYPVGVNEITIIATDDAGNTATCSFNITVTRNTPPSNSGNLVLETSDVNINQWSTGMVEFTLRNTGGTSIDDIRVSFNLEDNIRLQGGNEFDAFPNTTVTNAWSNLPIWNAGTLAPGEEKYVRFNVFAITSDPMYIFGQVLSANGADPNSSPGNGTPPTPVEDDEAVANINGGTPPPPPPSGQADLTLQNLALTDLSVKTGDVLNFTFDLANIGTANIPQNFMVRAYLSTDGDISNDDVQDGIVPTGNFDAGLIVQDVPGASTINLPEGQYYLILKVDADDQVSESDETNNVFQSNIQFTVDNSNGGGSICDKQVAIDANSTNCIEPVSGTNNIRFVYNNANGAVETILDTNLDVISSTSLPNQETKLAADLDNYTITKTDANDNVIYTRNVPQAFFDRFEFAPEVIEFQSGFVFMGWTGVPDDPKIIAVKTDNNFNSTLEKDVVAPGDLGRSYVRALSAAGDNILFLTGYNITFGTSATLKLWDVNLNELDELSIISGVWMGGASLSANECGKWTVTDNAGLGYCKSGGCYANGTTEIDVENNFINVIASRRFVHRTTLGIGSESYGWSVETSDGGIISAGRGQDLTGFNNPIPKDAQVNFKKHNANGNLDWNRDYLITDWQSIQRIYEDNGETYIVKKIDSELLISELSCYDLPANLPDLVITDVNAPASAVEGSSFNLSYTLRNTGTLASQSSIVGLYLSRDQQLGFDAPMRNVFPQYQSINPDGSIDVNIMVTANTNRIGTNYLLLVADAQAQNVESNEDNNLIVIPIEITEPNTGGVDLEISSNLPNSSPAQWSVFSPTVTITNNGGATATGVEIYFGPSDGAIFQGGNEGTVSQGTFRAWANTWDVGTLAAGQSATLDVNLFRLIGEQFVMYTQVTALNEPDVDSAPDNGTCCAGGEDDETPIYVGAAANSITNRSSIVEILGNQPFAIVNAMPNPFTDEFKLQVFSNENQESEITVMNAMGQAIFKKEVNLTEGLNTISMSLDSDASGILMVKMTPFHPYLRQIRVMRVRD